MDVSKIMKDKVALYVRKPNALVYGEKTCITPERDTVPVYRGDEVAMLPLRFFADSIGASLTYNAGDNSVVLQKNDKTLSFVIGESRFAVNGAEVALPVPTENIGGKAFAPADELCDALGIHLFYDAADMILYSENEINLSWDDDLETMRKISESFVFDDATGEEIISMIRENHPNNSHPRLLMTEDKFEHIRNELAKGEAGDPVYRKAFELYKSNAEKYLKEKPAFYEIRDGIRLLSVSQEVLDKIITLAVTYNLTGDERYAARARQELIAVCSFQDWHPYHFLDVGVMTIAVSFGYDWLYNYLDETDKELIRKAIVTDAFDPIIEDFDEVPTRVRTWVWRGNPVCNWRFIAGGGTALGALAIGDELEGEELAKAERVLEQTLLDIRPAISLFAPDGAYEEGLGYWDYACRHYAYFTLSLETAAGTDFGYRDAPGLRHTANFVETSNGSVSKLAFHDSVDGTLNYPPVIMTWIKKFGDYELAVPTIRSTLSSGAKTDTMLFYDSELLNANAAELPLDSFHAAVGTYSARSGFEQTDLWVGVHVDDAYAGPSHDHLDAGQFLLDADGENFFCELGSDNYNIPNYQCDTYVTRAEGHNCFIINPDGDWDMKFAGKASFSNYESKERGSFVTADLTDLYSEDADSAWRGVRLDNYRRTVYVQDEIKMKEPSEYYWFGHTKATDIDISEDGKTAILTQNGKKLIAEIIGCEDAKFSVMNAEPLPQSPNPAGQKDLSAFRKLVVHLENVSEVNLCIAMSAYNGTYDEACIEREIVPMANWSIPDGECKVNYATANSITVDGVPLDGFDPEKSEYEIVMTSLDHKPVVEASADSEVTVIPYEGVLGETRVQVARNGEKQKRTYTLRFVVPGYIGTPEGKTAIKPVSVTASSVPQPENSPENTLDGSLDTRWSCAGICWIEYDLGSVQSLDSVALAFMNGTSRTAQFSIELSKDGKDYVEYFNGDSLSTLDLESHAVLGAEARYVRINCFGWNGNRSNWNSITEVKIFKN